MIYLYVNENKVYGDNENDAECDLPYILQNNYSYKIATISKVEKQSAASAALTPSRDVKLQSYIAADC